MTFGFSQPHIHEVADIKAHAEVLTLGQNTMSPGKVFAHLSLTFISKTGEEESFNAYFDGAFTGRALDIAEAINASKSAKDAADMIAASDVLIADAAE